MHRVFVNEIAAVQTVQPLTPGEEEHLFRVLRARAGDRIGVMDGCGTLAEAEVLRDRRVIVLSRRELPREKMKLHLWCASPRKARFDDLLKQAAELGAASIRPVACEHSVAKPEGSGRWPLLLQEACKQSGNPYLPELLPPLSFKEAVAEAQKQGMALCYGALEYVPERPLPPDAHDLVWLVGPEGGFSPSELQILEAANAFPIHLGPWILRLETAAVCGLAVLRKLVTLLLLGSTLLFLAGCGKADVRKHPLMVRADRCRAKDPARAESLYRELLTKYPYSPELQLALATLYDESLNRPVAALYFYDEYLRQPEIGKESRALAAAGFQNAAGRAAKELNMPAVAEKEYWQRENAGLRRQLEFQRKFIANMHRQLQELKAKGGAK